MIEPFRGWLHAPFDLELHPVSEGREPAHQHVDRAREGAAAQQAHDLEKDSFHGAGGYTRQYNCAVEINDKGSRCFAPCRRKSKASTAKRSTSCAWSRRRARPRAGAFWTWAAVTGACLRCCRPPGSNRLVLTSIRRSSR